MPTPIRNFLLNAPLAKKIRAITLLCILLVASVSFAGMNLISNAYQKLLYQSIASSLSYSSTEMYNQLNNLNTMAELILADTAIQNNLSLIREPDSYADRASAFRQLYGVFHEYFFSFRQNHIRYMSLYQGDTAVHTDVLEAKTIPSEVLEDLKDRAAEAKGATRWVTDYSSRYGLFLVKDIRRIKWTSLEPLGILIVNVDPDGLVTSTTAFSSEYEDSSYLVYDQQIPVYHSPALSEQDARALKEDMKSAYAVVPQGGHDFFLVRGKVPEFGWDYVCAVSYDNIAESIRLSRNLCLLILTASIVTALLLSASLIRSLTRHLDNLVLKMKAFGDDDTCIRDVGYDYTARKDELGVLHTQFDHMAQEVRQLIQSNYVNELLKKEAQLKALENQINPHFLYNTLESMNWRAKAVGARDISAMAEALGNLLRMTLNQKSKQFTLRQELELIRSYMTIQKFRYEERLEYEIRIPEELMDCEIPKLTLQPLAENAIRYGLEEISEPCVIRIGAEDRDGVLYLSVSNNGSAFDDGLLEKLETGRTQPHGFGIGLLNIHQRIRMTYGQDFGLRLSNRDECAVAQITMPVHHI